MMALIIIPVIAFTPWSHLTNGHLGLLMLALICVGIMLGFPTAFTLMGMGVFFAWLAYRSVDPATADRRVLDLFVQRTYGVMSNDVLIAIPLFLFMGYLVERAQLIDRLFRSLHLATARVPGSLAVATIVTCAIFATATGIVGAVVTLMGLLAFPAMLKAGYNVKVAAGAVTAGGCLGILIPPSVMLIVYGAVAGVSVVQLYAGAFLPGFMLAGLYVGYLIVLAKWKPKLMPPLALGERRHELGFPLREDDEVTDVEPREHEAGQEGSGVELHDRHARDGAIDDQHDRGRDQDAEATARGHRARRHLDVVARLEHRRKREQTHQRHHRADDAGGGREDRAGDDRCYSQRPRYARAGQMQA